MFPVEENSKKISKQMHSLNSSPENRVKYMLQFVERNTIYQKHWMLYGNIF